MTMTAVTLFVCCVVRMQVQFYFSFSEVCLEIHGLPKDEGGVRVRGDMLRTIFPHADLTKMKCSYANEAQEVVSNMDADFPGESTLFISMLEESPHPVAVQEFDANVITFTFRGILAQTGPLVGAASAMVGPTDHWSKNLRIPCRSQSLPDRNQTLGAGWMMQVYKWLLTTSGSTQCVQPQQGSDPQIVCNSSILQSLYFYLLH